MTRVRPDLRHERALLRGGARLVVGMDEVGRGALAGPVSVGAVAVDLSTRTCPRGVADSKLLTAASRERLLPALGRWGVGRAVGHAQPAEIDAVGIVAALRLAGRRALAVLAARGVRADVVLLDGSHDWLSPPAQPTLLEAVPDEPALLGPAAPGCLPHDRDGDDDHGLPGPGADVTEAAGWPPVRLRVKADQRCASVAAASILAKCERDALMRDLDLRHPGYGWSANKGYGATDHVAALRLRGPCDQHRRSWRLPAHVQEADPAWVMMDA